MPTPLLTDSGLETWLVFLRGVDLPDFAAFPLLDTAGGRALLTEYFRDHLRVATEAGRGVVLETPTWRANSDWGARLGYDDDELDRVNRDAVRFVRALGDDVDVEVVVSGNIGPRGDGYDPAEFLAPEEAARYHRPQIDSFVAAGADRVTLLTATHAGEAIGVVQAAASAGIEVVVAFTVETDGRLPTGQPLQDAIVEVDAATGRAALYFGINCAHPDHSLTHSMLTQRRSSVSASCGQTPPAPVTLSSTKQRSSTTAIPWSWRINTLSCFAAIRTFRCSAAAVAPTSATSRQSCVPR